MFKKFNCFLMSVLLLVSVCPTPVIAGSKSLVELSKNYGLTPSDLKIGKQNSTSIKSINLPKKFDLREESGVTSIKNQNPFGTCWSFGTMAAIESNTKYTTGKEVDLSELNLAVDRLGAQNLNHGGNYAMSASYFANWKGPVLEKDDPYPSSEQVTSNVNAPAAYHMQNSLFLPSRSDPSDNQAIKEAIIQKGAVAISYYHDDNYIAADGKSYCFTGAPTSNHAVVLVGYDDDYSKDNFKDKPQGNGAFIVKNSWGDRFGESGYFYISYYDTSLGKGLISVFEPLEQEDNYDNRYNYGNFNINYSVVGSPTEKIVANKHKAINNEDIGAVSIYTFSTNVAYDIYIDEDYKESNYPNNDASYLLNTKKVKSGVLSYGGFNTIKLDKPTKVDSGKNYLVAIKVKDVYSASIPFKDTEGKGNTFNIYGNMLSSNTYGANTLVTYTDNRTANDITSVTLDKTSLTLGLGDKVSLKATVIGSAAANKKVLWSTANSKIAVVDEDGVVTTKGNGATVITAATRDGVIKTSAAVSVSSPLAVLTSSKKIQGQEVGIIKFNDIINPSTDYSKIFLKDKDGNLLPVTMSIDYKSLSIKVNTKYLGIGKLSIPSKALINNSGRGLAGDLNLDIAINNYDDTDIVNIGSPTIRKAVATQLNKGETTITAGDLRQVTDLNITEDIIDLKDIGMLSSLDTLNLTATSSSINSEDLQYLTSLDSVNFTNIEMINMNYLKNNKGLSYLSIQDSGLYTLEGIEGLTALSYIDLENNNIRDISNIGGLRNIQNLKISNNKITDITPLKACTSIVYLYLDHNEIKDIKPLEGMVNTYSFDLSYNEISDISFLQTLSGNRSQAPWLSMEYNFVAPEDTILAYLRDTKAWTIWCNSKRDDFYELNDYKISNNELNSKRPTIFSFNKDIKSVTSGNINANYYTNTQDLNYEIRGNKLLIHDEELRKQSIPYSFYVDLTIIDEDGMEQTLNSYVNVDGVRSEYFNEDINKDGLIDIADIAKLAKDYNLSAKGDVKWNFDEDINLDGIIDIYDLSRVSLGF